MWERRAVSADVEPVQTLVDRPSSTGEGPSLIRAASLGILCQGLINSLAIRGGGSDVLCKSNNDPLFVIGMSVQTWMRAEGV